MLLLLLPALSCAAACCLVLLLLLELMVSSCHHDGEGVDCVGCSSRFTEAETREQQLSIRMRLNAQHILQAVCWPSGLAASKTHLSVALSASSAAPVWGTTREMCAWPLCDGGDGLAQQCELVDGCKQARVAVLGYTYGEYVAGAGGKPFMSDKMKV